MTKTLEQYLAESAVVHEFRVKIAKEPTDEQLDKMELHLRKYDAFDVTTPKRTIIQANPSDFRSIKATEVYMIDFKTHAPVTPHMLLNELVQKMGVHERFMIVRNKAEPLHIEDEVEEAKEEEYVTRLTDSEYTDAEPVDVDSLYGDKFIASFIKDIAKDRVEHNTEHKD